jgi:hypothetical protein
MPIAMPKFASEGQLMRFDFGSHGLGERSAQLVIQCRVCNFEPDLNSRLPRVCPKCHASVWEWFARRDHVVPSERAGHRFKFRKPRASRVA